MATKGEHEENKSAACNSDEVHMDPAFRQVAFRTTSQVLEGSRAHPRIPLDATVSGWLDGGCSLQ